ncbi:hypothetical protein [Arthrobacter sp. UM1]|uniref:hypothetical protein n=1 Tax=Arthrobacter sp. UM1 TaxID=2766776 RepID=UPI001CF6B4D9|nr:hypothetical protein [Arthrobacter sp. UM1]MCB4209155.1 hypothetical protein [Arthrobacter sp. UM1]
MDIFSHISEVFKAVYAFLKDAAPIGGLIAGGYAVRQFRLNRKNSDAQTRPYISARLLPGIWGPGNYDLLVENHGKSAARDIRLTIDGSIDDPKGDGALAESLRKPYTGNYSFDLPPGARRRFAWKLKISAATHEGVSSGPVPLNITYTDSIHLNKKKDKYSENISVDAEELGKLLAAPLEGFHPADRKSYTLKHIADRLALLVRAIERNHIE